MPFSGFLAARRCSGVSSPWSAELRTMWVSGSLIRSSTWRSSSVSAPCISSSISLLSSLARSRMMRGSFCQALPIGCMRVFMTPSCSSAVTLERRCSGTLNSESSCRRAISSSWLRVSTSSETMVIRDSSVSTLTRIDWLATFESGLSSTSSTTGLRSALAGFAFSASRRLRDGRGLGGGFAERALEFVERDFARAQRALERLRDERAVDRGLRGLRLRLRRLGAAAAAGTVPSIAMRSSSPIRSLSSPSGSASFCSSPPSTSFSRSMVDRMSVTASPVTGMPSRNLPISVSAACASASRRGSPRKPQVPLMVWTRRKMLSRILALFGSCSNRTSSTSTVSRLSFVSVRNSRSRSSIGQ